MLGVHGPWSTAQVIRKSPAPGAMVKETGKPAYTPMWTLRGVVISHMRSAGIKQLKVDSCPIARFAKSFPDQGECFKRYQLARASRRATCRDFFSMMQYSGPPELWAMYACLFSDKCCARVSTEWLETHAGALRSDRIAYKKAHSQNPVPGVLLEMYLLSSKDKRRRDKAPES